MKNRTERRDMRLRRKKHLEDRVSASSAFLINRKTDGKGLSDLPSAEKSAISAAVSAEKSAARAGGRTKSDRVFLDFLDKEGFLDFSSVFGNDRPVYLEIGCGKGAFSLAYARQYPDRNLLAVEKVTNVLVAALERAEEMRARGEKLDNLRYFDGGVEFMAERIRPGSVSGIILNFSCPYPKNTYENRRLTSPRFLEIYQSVLKKGGTVEQKTDNRPFFDYSLRQFAAKGFEQVSITYDLYAALPKENIETEYERVKRLSYAICRTVQRSPGPVNAAEKCKNYIAEHLPRTVRAPHGFLPKPFTVPCESGGFRNFYYWDTYFTNFALYLTGNAAQAKNNLDDFAAEVERFGFIPNADHLTDRSQPPLFARATYDYLLATDDRNGVKALLPAIKKELAFWETRKKPSGCYGWGGGKEGAELLAFNAYVCDRLHVEPAETASEQYAQAKGFMAIAESGWDFNYRFGKDFRGADYTAVDLTSLLYDAYRKAAELAKRTGEEEYAAFAQNKAEEIGSAMSRLLSPDGIYRDRDEKTGRFSDLFTAASLYPYAVGAAETAPENVFFLLDRLLQSRGVSVGEPRESGDYLQWDYPMMWAPTTYFLYLAAKNTGNYQKAAEISNKFRRTAEECFVATGQFWEKYDAVTGLPGGGVEYDTPPMLGWTAGVYLWLNEDKEALKKAAREWRKTRTAARRALREAAQNAAE